MNNIYFFLKKSRYQLLLITSVSIIFFNPAYAYGGPGLAIGAIIVLITIIVTFFASLFLKIFELIKKIIKYIFKLISKKGRKTQNKKNLNKK